MTKDEPVIPEPAYFGRLRSWLSHLFQLLTLVALILWFLGIFGFLVWFERQGTGKLSSIMIDHFPVIIGLPASALTSLGLVQFLESNYGNIEFKGLGFEFKGASGPIILWVLSFLSIVLSIKVLW